jgi:hypothetical protein
MNGPVNEKRLDEIRVVLNTFQEALLVDSSGSTSSDNSAPRMEAIMELFREASSFVADPRFRENSGPLLEELQVGTLGDEWSSLPFTYSHSLSVSCTTPTVGSPERSSRSFRDSRLKSGSLHSARS